MALYFLPALARAQYGDPLPAASQPDSATVSEKGLDVLSLGLEVVSSPGEGSFFADYGRLGGHSSSIDPTTLVSLTMKVEATKALRLAYFGGYMRVGFDESYIAPGVMKVDTGAVAVPLAGVTEKFHGTVIPIMAGGEWAPVRSQFTSYVGAMAGLSISSLSWTTEARSTGVIDYYRPVTNVDGIGISPAARLYVGLDLRFDYFSAIGGPFRGIYIEAAYLYLPLIRDYFGELRKTGQGLPVLPAHDGATVNAGGVTLSFGLSLQIPRR